MMKSRVIAVLLCTSLLLSQQVFAETGDAITEAAETKAVETAAAETDAAETGDGETGDTEADTEPGTGETEPGDADYQELAAEIKAADGLLLVQQGAAPEDYAAYMEENVSLALVTADGKKTEIAFADVTSQLDTSRATKNAVMTLAYDTLQATLPVEIYYVPHFDPTPPNMALKAKSVEASDVWNASVCPALNAIDDNLTTFWGAKTGTVENWITINLGANQKIDYATINSREQFKKPAYIQVPNGDNWTTVATFEVPTAKVDQRIDLLPDGIEASRIRFLFDADTVGGSGPAIYEIGFYSNDPLSLEPVIIVDGEEGGDYHIIQYQDFEPGDLLYHAYDYEDSTEEQNYMVPDEDIVIDDGGFDADVPGTYTVVYSYTDNDGHTASATRNIVVDTGKPTEGDFAYDVRTEGVADSNLLVDGNPYTHVTLPAGTESRIVFEPSGTTYIDSLVLKKNGDTPVAYTLAFENEETRSGTAMEGTWTEAESEFVLEQATGGDRIVLTLTPEADTQVHTVEMFITPMGRIDVAHRALDPDISWNDISKDVVLPTSGLCDTDILWESSDESIMDGKGNITRGTRDRNVTLTAVITYQGGSEKMEKEFEAVVTGKGSSNNGGGSGGRGGSGGGSGRPSYSTGVTVPVIETPVEPQKPLEFADVAKTHWAHAYIVDLAEKGVMEGDGTGNFYPERFITREEFVKIVAVAFEIEGGQEDATFEDIKNGDWFYPYVTAAAKNGIVNGISEHEFGVGQNITREDMAVILSATMKWKNITLAKSSEVIPGDQDAISGYAQDAVLELFQAGVLNGNEQNQFLPKDFASRAEVSKVVSLLLAQ